MLRLFLVLVLTFSFSGCAPPRWAEPLCRDQPNTRNMEEQELAARLTPMSDEQLLDLAACNMGTSHPSTLGYPDRFVTQRSPAMAALLLDRIEQRNEGLISMGYMMLLEEMVKNDPGAISEGRRESARAHCERLFTGGRGACESL